MTAAPVVPTLQDPTTGNRPPGALFGASCERRVNTSDTRRDLRHQLRDGRAPSHVRHYGDLGMQPQRAVRWPSSLRSTSSSSVVASTATRTVCPLTLKFHAHDKVSEVQGSVQSWRFRSFSARAVEITSNSASPFSFDAASGLPMTPDPDRLPILRHM
jgi:hypothetical protein